MELPNGEVILHEGKVYDPAKAHDYYLRTRKLKGRKKGSEDSGVGRQGGAPSKIHADQKKQLAARVNDLEGKLAKLEDLIKKKEAALKRSPKAQQKPNAADKSKKARESKQYRQKHQSKLKAQAKKASAKSGGGSGKGSGSKSPVKSPKGMPIKDLKMLSAKVRGQIHTAKAKLSAL